jgi:glycosyltransferase involved in cell wall biosynthesis
LLESIEAATTLPHRVLFIASPSDDAEQDAIRATGADLLVLNKEPRSGDYARKINAGYRATTEPLLFLAADDLHFHADWFERAAARVAGAVQVVGTNDLGNRRVIAGEHSTHTLVTRRYADDFGTIDEPGSVLHEGYPHEFVDDELVGTAKHRGVWDHAGDSIVEHLHPHWGKAPSDELYEAEPERMVIGRRIFRERRHLWT